jgi:AI-2 transport protein TqsA
MPSTSPSPEPDRPVSAVEAPAQGAPRMREADRTLALPRGLLVLLSVAGVVVAVAGLRSASGIVGPAFLALMIVITIHPLLAWLQRHRVPGWLAVVLTMLVAYTSLVALAAWLGERGVTQEQIDAAVSQFDLNTLVGVLQRVVSGTTNVVSDLAFILVLLFFLIIDSSSLPQRLGTAATQRPQLVEALTGFAGATRQCIVVSTVFGLLVALVDVAALYWLDVPLPWLWGLLAFITNCIPNIGFVLGLIPPALLALLAVPLSLFAKALLVDADLDSRWLDPLIAPGRQDDGDGPGREGGGEA